MNSLNQHGAREAHKQLVVRMKKSGLKTIKVTVTRKFGRVKVDFAGSADEVKKAQQILADWS